MIKIRRTLTTIIIVFLIILGLNESKLNAVTSSNSTTRDFIIDESGEYVVDRINIKVKDAVSTGFNLLSIFGFNNNVLDFSQYGINALDELEINDPNQVFIQSTQETSTWYSASLDGSLSVQEVIDALEENDRIVIAEPDYIRTTAAEGLPNETTDPGFAQQWYLNSVKAPEAWAYLQANGINSGGSRDVIIAVIDTGVDYIHPDLNANMWRNSREIPGNSIDDDNNGYVDDVYGINTITNSGNPMDDHGHGTHVAGIIGMVPDNGIGGVGIAYNSQIMAIKAGSASGYFTSSDVTEAIYYAIRNGADVINMSFGGYTSSSLERDALQVAFGTSVLVAAAGNDGLCNEGKYCAAMYPASYPYVLGIMAQSRNSSINGDNLANFSNYDTNANNSIEYEMMAPGVGIYSTLPNNRYANWSGTSMSAPMVSATAAIVRSFFTDKSIFSSRFIMGQISSTGPILQGKTDPKIVTPIKYSSTDISSTLSNVPNPDVQFYEKYLFDSTSVNPTNNNNGVIDAGETVDLAIIIKNHWGQADNVQVQIDAKSFAAIPNPYVEFITDTVEYYSVGNFATDDNGILYENDVIVGVENPFKIHVLPNTPNDTVIKFNVKIAAKNGLDLNDSNLYTTVSSFELVVRNGKLLPSVISTDMTLTKDTYWIIDGPTLIESGVTVTVEPGASIQFYASEPYGPYSTPKVPYLQVEGSFIAEGTFAEPINIFPSSLYNGYMINISSTKEMDIMGLFGAYSPNLYGFASLKFVNLANPGISVNEIDHCKFYQEDFMQIYKYQVLLNGTQNVSTQQPRVFARNIRNSIFANLGGSRDDENLMLLGNLEGNLFDNSTTYLNSYYDSTAYLNKSNTYLKNYKRTVGGYVNSTFSSRFEDYNLKLDSKYDLQGVYPITDPITGHSYFVINSDQFKNQPQIIEDYAKYLGGHIATIDDSTENLFLVNYLIQFKTSLETFTTDYPNLASIASYYTNMGIGLNDYDKANNFTWISGVDSGYRNWYYANIKPDYVSSSTTGAAVLGIAGWYFLSNVNSYIIEIPDTSYTVNQVFLDQKREEYLLSGMASRITNNAFLNVWEIPGTNHWMKFYSSTGKDNIQYLSNNYWGTTKEMVDKAIMDYSDDFTRAKIVFEPLLVTAPESAYPFVTDVYLKNSDNIKVSKVSSETLTVNVTFNRDMDQTIQPQVSYGPDEPYTDFMVSGEWVDARTWSGSTSISPIANDGYQYFRVSGAVAANDPWLVTGNDSERFRFEVNTVGSESMNLQASGEENQIRLMWKQNDFELLAGYNIYRSESAEGTFIKINSSLISDTQSEYVDSNVNPGQTLYYKFTVVQTDFSESQYSNIATASALDTIPPSIIHSSVNKAITNQPITVVASISDNIAVLGATLYYKSILNPTWTSKPMVTTGSNQYSATIEGSFMTAPGVYYYIQATDGVGIARSGSSSVPHLITILDNPDVTSLSTISGSSSGGETVIISGTNFKTGASVYFGDSPVSNVVVNSENRITVSTPAHFPAVVDVTVVNPDGNRNTLLNAYTYKGIGTELSLPETEAYAGQSIEVPVTISGVSGLLGANFDINYDSTFLTFTGIRSGNLTSNFNLVTNTNTPGLIRVALAGDNSVSGDGSLIVLDFTVLDQPSGSKSLLTLSSATFNDGAIETTLINGSFTMSMKHKLSGQVNYYSNLNPVPGVNFTLSGLKQFNTVSLEAGSYELTGIEYGDYTLSAVKNNGTNGISALDASYALMSSVGLMNLSTYQTIAGDVNGNGVVNAMDASYILQTAVGIRTGAFPGTGKVWDFIISNPIYTGINGDLVNQNILAILLGDISGNWTNPIE